MARAKTLELLDPAPAPAASKNTLKKCCGTCAHWRPNNQAPWIGQCMPSAAGRQSPIETLDLAGCSHHKFYEGA